VAVKLFELENIGTVRISKRSGSRSVRLSIAANGEIRVTIPSWSPYQNGIDFARSRADWIAKNIPEKEAPLHDGGRIGKAHRLVFVTAVVDAPTVRLAGGDIRVSRPPGMTITHPEVQKVAQRGCIRALRAEAEHLLPQRLRALAEKFGFSYTNVSVKQLKGRWGSCDSKQQIVLNLFLMQLPWRLIDYVLLHELVHTKHLNHGADFWDEFTRHEPAAKQLRKLTRQHKPVLAAVAPKPLVA
jgi:hypothetical protein